MLTVINVELPLQGWSQTAGCCDHDVATGPSSRRWREHCGSPSADLVAASLEKVAVCHSRRGQIPPALCAATFSPCVLFKQLWVTHKWTLVSHFVWVARLVAFWNGIRLVKAIVIEWGVVSPVCWESLDSSCFRRVQRRCSQNSFICMLHVVIVSVYLPWWSVVRTVFMYGSWHLLCLLHHRVQQQLLQLSRSSQFSCQAIFQRCHVPLRGCDWQPL